MDCPECRAEYRDGFTECSDCRVPLVAKLPAEPASEPSPDPLLDLEPYSGPPTPDAEFVTVFSTGDPIVFALAKGSLEDAAIPIGLPERRPGVPA